MQSGNDSMMCVLPPQAALTEIVTGMKQGVTELLGLWRQANGGQLPEVIIIFR